MDKILSPVLSFFLTSLLFYSLLLFLVQKPAIEFDYESFIEIEMTNPIVENNVIEKVKEEKIEEEKVEEEKSVEKETPSKEKNIEQEVATQKRSVSDLFGESNLKKITKELTTHEYRIEKVQVKKASIDLEKIFKKEQKEQKDTSEAPTFKSKKNTSDIETENKYLKLLHNMLLSSWITKPEDAGKRAQIVFLISADGSFVYYFKSFSQDQAFKARLMNSLESLKSRKLPSNEKSIKVTVNFIAKE